MAHQAELLKLLTIFINEKWIHMTSINHKSTLMIHLQCIHMLLKRITNVLLDVSQTPSLYLPTVEETNVTKDKHNDSE